MTVSSRRSRLGRGTQAGSRGLPGARRCPAERARSGQVRGTVRHLPQGGRTTAAGLTIVVPEVGEHVTSLDMAGVSLTLTFLDPETEMYWTAPAAAPAFSRGSPDDRPMRTDDDSSRARREITAGTPDSRTAAQSAVRALDEVRDVLIENEARLGDIDAVAGEGDRVTG